MKKNQSQNNSINGKMTFKEKFQLYIKINKKLIETQKQLEDIDNEISTKKSELEDIDNEISTKKSELEDINNEKHLKKEELKSLKKEVVELKDFINKKFNNEFRKNSDHLINIHNCYIISFKGKKYITLREVSTIETEKYDDNLGWFVVDNYFYSDALCILKNRTFKYLCQYNDGHYSYGRSHKYYGYKPNYEEYILDVYPELKIYEDGKVPDAHLKKIYYEINNLGNLSTNEKQMVSSNQLVKKG